jgi:hypothetical protein
MKALGPERDHYFLALGMSRIAGADVAQATADGRFDQSGWAAAVQRCRGCDWASECPSWMAMHETVERAPSTCVNSDLFARLRDGEDLRSPGPAVVAETGHAGPR